MQTSRTDLWTQWRKGRVGQIGRLRSIYIYYQASQVALVIKDWPANVGDVRDVRSVHELGRFLGEGHGNLLQYSCLENPMDR